MIRIAFFLLVLVGCAPSRQLVRETPPRRTEFGEFITVPGQYVAKASNNDAAPNETAFFPPRAESVRTTEHFSTLLTPAAATDPPLVAALRDYLEGRTEKAVERINGLDSTNQELILRLLPALVHASRADFRASNEAALLASQLEAVSEATSKLATLKIRRACFVWRVTQFGVYEPVPEKHPFLPGGAGQLYLELQNAPCEAIAAIPAGGSGYVTRLECAYKIVDINSQVVESITMRPHAEYHRSPIRDYFLKVEFKVPPEPGQYTLVVELRDPATGRKASHSSAIHVAQR